MTALADTPTTADHPVVVETDRRHTIAFAALLVGTAVMYLWNLSINKYANDFYAAAEQAGSQSWKAWFFGASDAGNSITVDKPPLSLWISGVAVRVFGLNSWSILVPQALMGVATVALVYLIARRLAGPNAGLVAGAVLALEPVAAVMFRFNNPDALLVLLLIGAAWATTRILDDGRLRWALLAGGLIGLAFLTKQLQALLIVPPIAVAYLVFGPPSLGKRVLHLLAALAALVVGAGWWVLTVELWPARSRPYIGGSEHNSIIELTLGYNGLGRLTGDESSGLGGGAPGGGSGGSGEGMLAMFGGHTGILRMFSPIVGGQIGWLIPAALILGATAIVLRGRSARTDLERSVLVFAWLWLFSNALLMSYMAGIFHPYYTLALVPPIGLLVGVGAVRTWRSRQTTWVRGVLAATVVVTAALAVVILRRTPDFQSWLQWVVIVVAVIAVVGLLVDRVRPGRIASRTVIAAALVVGLAGPVAYSVDTIATTRVGGLASAGPQTMEFPDLGGARRTGPAVPAGAAQAARRIFTGEAPPRAVTDLIARGADGRRWAAATVSALSASGYQLAMQRPVMPVGGFSGGDPSPTLAQFQRYVADGDIGWFIGFVSPIPQRNSTSSAAQITTWVTQHYRAQTVAGTTLYDLRP